MAIAIKVGDNFTTSRSNEQVKALEVVLAGGRVIRTGTLAPKSSSGYDLTRLFATSEGTLGIITELTVRILPSPEYSVLGRLSFPSPGEAGAAAAAFLSEGLPVSTCEILDGVSIEAVKKAMNLRVPRGATCLLFVELTFTKVTLKKYNRDKDANNLQEG